MIINVLDCTLRDGGYVNNWEFDVPTARRIMDRLYDAGIRYIEVGILGGNATPGKQTKFNSPSEIAPYLAGRKPDCHYAVMFTQENAGSFVFPPCGDDTPDCIRIAFFKKTWREAFSTVKELKAKGYRVFLQAMATFMYSDGELAELIGSVNETEPAAFYMVDSFSTMLPDDVTGMRDFVLSRLSPAVAFGFHAHNSIQMAFSNAQRFLEGAPDRELFLDSSIFGMGRGAGNVPTELLLEHLNSTQGARYDVLPVIEAFETDLKPVYEQYGWGYTLPYFLVARHRVNSVYGWYFGSHGITDPLLLDKCLSLIPEDCKYTLKREIADQIMETVANDG